MIRTIAFEQVEVGDKVRIERLEEGFEVTGVVIAKDSERVRLAGSGSWFNLSQYSTYDSTISLLDRPVKLPNKQGAIVGHKEYPGAFMAYVLTGYGDWVALDSEGQTHSRAQDVVQGSLKSGDWEVKFEGYGEELNND